MDSDPEPRATPSSQSQALVTGAQPDESAEEPPSPFQSSAFVLGPLIAALTLLVPFTSVLSDRAGSFPGSRIQTGPELMGVSPRPPWMGSPSGSSGSPAAGSPTP